ncbi:MAG: diheme cytochrome c [Thiobacillus sp.]|nr:diheme cytochrome c [Gammaproteobacteria bacterium]MBU4499565.1 diheme cytochrome c [Gammaproteobacteria bacterium]MDO9007409.1 diheme cytochrome c [Thiobacillus sp.]MDP1923214.1 diheme cytochrome c [Thiobacillus sp.]MDP3126032.1 diheme cytochrome c [Thiobacillus sp.]
MNYLMRGIGVLATVGAVSLLAFSLPSGEARGDGGGDALPKLTHKNWQQECASCHLAYSPALLPKASWRRVMGGLDQHFGENASLDPVTQADILRFLETHAADSGNSAIGNKVMRRQGADKAPLRITETRWFVNKHDEVPRAAWSRKAVGSAANCAACHRKAEQGVFNEHDVRIPK